MAGESIALRNARLKRKSRAVGCNVIIAEKQYGGSLKILKGQSAINSFVRKNVIVHGKIKIYVAEKTRLIGWQGKLFTGVY